MVHGKFHSKLSACKQAVQNYMPVSDREEKMEDVMSITSMHESIMTDFVNSLLNTKKSQVINIPTVFN